MSRIGKIARRTFLFGTVAIAGGVAFGVYKLKEEAPNPLTPGEGEVTLNPFILINQDGVTLIAPKAEMGQGVHTTWAALLAEELDVDLDQVRVLHGPPAKAYYNSALFGSALPFLDYKIGDFQEGMRHFIGDAAKLLSLQLTGGSTSMRDGYERMREAGATVRETFKLVAAKRLGVTVGELRTEGGNVIAGDGTTLSYVDLAAEAAEIDPPKVALRPASEWRILGKSQPRVDMVGKVTGTAQFGIDARPEGLCFATVRMNPRRSGMISFDPSAALTMDGVEKIIDLGDGIAVVASNTWLAMQAAEAVEIEWAAADYPPEMDGIMGQIAAAFDGEVNATPRDDGKPDAAHEGTEITAEYTIPFLAHATMEPMNATALFTGDALTIWSGNQAPVMVRNKCAEAVGLTPEQVTVHTTLMGGGFGRRAEADFSILAARVAGEMPDTPVKVTWSREEDMTHDMYRPAAIARFRGIVQDGQAILLDGQVAAPSVSKQSGKRLSGSEMPGPDRETLAGSFDQPYGIPNFRMRGYLADLSVPVGFWRSVGNSMNGFFFDTFIDEMAHAAGRDPLQFRLELIRREHEPSAKLIEAVAEMSNWSGPKPAGVGRGVAFTYSFGTPVAEVIEVAQTPSGIKLTNCWIACDPGVALDPSIIEAQMIGGAIYGLSAAMQEKITFEDGAAVQQNFPDYDAMRIHTAPKFEVRILQNNRFIGGVGEPGTPPAAAALGNAIFDLTGQRIRRLPLNESVNFSG